MSRECVGDLSVPGYIDGTLLRCIRVSLGIGEGVVKTALDGTYVYASCCEGVLAYVLDVGLDSVFLVTVDNRNEEGLAVL